MFCVALSSESYVARKTVEDFEKTSEINYDPCSVFQTASVKNVNVFRVGNMNVNFVARLFTWFFFLLFRRFKSARRTCLTVQVCGTLFSFRPCTCVYVYVCTCLRACEYVTKCVYVCVCVLYL